MNFDVKETCKVADMTRKVYPFVAEKCGQEILPRRGYP
jgi:hypothetical protein